MNTIHVQVHSSQSVCVPACVCLVCAGTSSMGLSFFASQSIYGFVLKKFSSKPLKLLVIDEDNLLPRVSHDI